MTTQPGGGSQDQHRTDRWHARERTELAWTRSVIAFLATGVAILKFRPLIGVPLLLFGAAISVVNRRPPRRDWDGAMNYRLLLVALTVTCLAVLVLILTLAGPSSAGLRP